MTEKSEIMFYSKLNDTFEVPCQPSKCKWHLNSDSRNFPHSKQDWKRKSKICPDITAAIGNTPLVRLNKIPQSAGLKCNVYAKCEYLNPGGSAKDRVAKRMIEDAERHGLLKPGMTIIESSSGNAGIALALQAAIKGYKAIIIISEFSTISSEKLAVLKALGAEIFTTPLTASIDAPDGFIGAATILHEQIPNSIILDQFTNPASPLAHYDTTAEEILDQLDEKIDMMVIGAGTGGTITGIGRKLKERNPNTKVIGVDPIGSTIAQPEEINHTESPFFEVDGIGFCFVSTVLDKNVVDSWVKTTDKESMVMARRIIREEGLLVGNSSGAALSAALRVGKDLDETQNMVLIFADGIRNYLSSFLLDPWMETRKYSVPVNNKNLWWWDKSVRDLNLQQLYVINECNNCMEVLNFARHHQVNQIGITDKYGDLVGMVSKKKLVDKILTMQRDPEEKITFAMRSQFPKAALNSSLGLVSRMLEIEDYVVIVQDDNCGSTAQNRPLGIIYNTDILEYVSKKSDAKESDNFKLTTMLKKEIIRFSLNP